jgi:hypothetical protein
MASQTNDQESRSRNVTGYIHYNKSDDLTKTFEVLKEFRTKYGLKFSHHRDYVFFSLKSDYLDELAKKQPFRISHYRSKSEYKCDENISEKLLGQSDSFLRMTYNKENGVVQFLSRTTGYIHRHLVIRVFNDSDVSFDKNNYTNIRIQNQDDEQTENKNNEDGFIEVTYRKRPVQQAQQSQQAQPVREQIAKSGKTFDRRSNDDEVAPRPRSARVPTGSKSVKTTYASIVAKNTSS